MPQTINSLHTQTRTLQIFAKLSTDTKKRIHESSTLGKEKYATSAMPKSPLKIFGWSVPSHLWISKPISPFRYRF